jgi:O-6-methylguanine DNA methyltransferase
VRQDPLRRGFAALRDAKAPARFVESVIVRAGAGTEYVKIATPIGGVFVAYGPHGVVAVRRAKSARAFEAWYRRAYGRTARPDLDPDPAFVARLRKRAEGDRRPRLTIDLGRVSPFERAVLEKAQEIPRGQMRPYAWLAQQIGRPSAVRAVGNALGRNPVPLLIPCHRIVRGDGAPGHYVFGDAAKRALLRYEGAL